MIGITAAVGIVELSGGLGKQGYSLRFLQHKIVWFFGFCSGSMVVPALLIMVSKVSFHSKGQASVRRYEGPLWTKHMYVLAGFHTCAKIWCALGPVGHAGAF